MSREQRSPGLDALRGMAIALVLVSHALPEKFPLGGVTGVLLFFTLSGYLITGVLLVGIGRHGHVDYRRFYRNRALRLLPALVLMLFILATVTALFDPLGDRDGLLRGLLVAVTYTADLPIDQGLRSITHLWSLSVEEQFYLLWPALLAIGVATRKLPLLAATAAVGAVVACTASVLLVADDGSLYKLPTTWAITLIAGALARTHRDRAAAAVRHIPGLAGVAIVTGLVVFGTFGNELPTSLVYIAGGPLIALLSVVLIMMTESRVTVATTAVRPWVALGTVSYAAYLWNWPVTLWVNVADIGQPVAASVGIVGTLAAASASWFVLEQPVAAWRGRMDRREVKVAQAS